MEIGVASAPPAPSLVHIKAPRRPNTPNAALGEADRAAKKARKRVAKGVHRAARALKRQANVARFATEEADDTERVARGAHSDNPTDGALLETCQATVNLKDDMGNTYAVAPAAIVAAARALLGGFMPAFLDEPAFTTDRRRNQAAAAVLLDRMKKGTQRYFQPNRSSRVILSNHGEYDNA
jgi:hypothetical protein